MFRNVRIGQAEVVGHGFLKVGGEVAGLDVDQGGLDSGKEADISSEESRYQAVSLFVSSGMPSPEHEMLTSDIAH